MFAEAPVDYAKLAYRYRQHHERFVRHVEAMERKLICQWCRGGGGFTEPVLDDGSGPWEQCGWCEGTGYVTPHLRGAYLRCCREEKRQKTAIRGE